MGLVEKALKAVSPFLSPLGAITSIIGGLTAIFSKPPSIKIPKIEIPKVSADIINKALAQTSQLSEEARQTITQAISMYQQGKLLPQYQAQLEEWWRENYKRLLQEASARGITDSSMFLSMVQDLQRKYQSLYGDYLQKQLADALKLSGIAEADIQTALTAQQQAINTALAQAELSIQAQQLGALRGASIAQIASTIGQGMQSLGQTLPGLLDKTGTIKTTIPQEGKLDISGGKNIVLGSLPQLKKIVD